MNKASKYIPPLLVFSLSAVLGLVVVFLTPGSYIDGDEPGYIGCARSVSKGLGFSVDGVTPSVGVPPLFSSSLGLWFFLTGTQSVVSARVFQVFMFALGSVVSYFLIRMFFPSPYLSLLISFIIVFNPFLFTNVALIYQEHFLMFITTSSVLLTIQWFKKPTFLTTMSTGILWGLAVLSKIVNVFVPFFLIALISIFRNLPKLKDNKIPSISQSLLMFLFFILTVAPWTLRNYFHFHKLVIVNEQGTRSLRWFVERSPFLQDVGSVSFLEKLDQKNLDEKEVRSNLIRFIKGHPIQVLKQVLLNVILFTYGDWYWFTIYARKLIPNRCLRRKIISAVLHGPLYLGFFVFGWVSFHKRNIVYSFLFWFYVLYWLEYSLIWVEARYALPLFPLLVIMGIYGLIFLREKFHGTFTTLSIVKRAG